MKRDLITTTPINSPAILPASWGARLRPSIYCTKIKIREEGLFLYQCLTPEVSGMLRISRRWCAGRKHSIKYKEPAYKYGDRRLSKKRIKLFSRVHPLGLHTCLILYLFVTFNCCRSRIPPGFSHDSCIIFPFEDLSKHMRTSSCCVRCNCRKSQQLFDVARTEPGFADPQQRVIGRGRRRRRGRTSPTNVF